MATIDISILNSVTIIIVFMLIFVGGWGVLQVANPFKDAGKSLYGLMAFLLAVLMVLSSNTVEIVLFATPWLILLALIGFYFIFYARMFGTSEGDITNVFKNKLVGWMVFLGALVIVFAIGSSYGPELADATTPGTVVPTVPTNTGEVIVTEDGTVIVNDDTSVVGPATATNDFGRNLTMILFHPKILGVAFLFLLGTLTILLLNQGIGGDSKGGGGGHGGGGHH